MVNNIQSNNSNVTSLRDKLLPPHDISAEQAIIAALFIYILCIQILL